MHINDVVTPELLNLVAVGGVHVMEIYGIEVESHIRQS